MAVPRQLKDTGPDRRLKSPWRRRKGSLAWAQRGDRGAEGGDNTQVRHLGVRETAAGLTGAEVGCGEGAGPRPLTQTLGPAH